MRFTDAEAEPGRPVADALVGDAPPDLFDAIAGVEHSLAQLTAVRAQLIDLARRGIALSERARPGTRTAHAVEEHARRVLVAELAALLRMSASAAAQLVGESRALAGLPLTMAALAAGEISYRHATIVLDNAASLPDEARSEYEQAVLADARRLNPPRFRDRARRIREKHHPDSLSVRRTAQYDRRNVSVEPARDGMAWLSLYGPAEQVIAIDDRLDRIAASMRSPDDPRTFAQLKADAFCELLLDGEMLGAGHAGIRPQVLVAVPALTLLKLDDEPATLEGYGPIPAEVARQLAAEAPSFVRLLTHPETGAVLSVGRDRYTVPADMRMFLRIRDETCRGVGCGRRAATSDIDHGHEWAEGGTTSVDNLAHLCRGDHTRKTALGWRVTHLPHGVLEWTTPFGRTYRTEPSAVIRT